MPLAITETKTETKILATFEFGKSCNGRSKSRRKRKLLNVVLFTVQISTILTTFYYIKQERKCKNFQKKNCFKNVKISKILMFFKIQGGGA
jgi:hypothetical protein